MLDIRLVRSQPDDVRARLARRGKDDAQAVDALLALDEKRRTLLAQVEDLKSERNRASKQVGALMGQGKKAEADEIKARMKEVSDRIAALDAEVAHVETDQRAVLLRVPNLPHDSVPHGQGSEDNPVVATWGAPPSFDFTPVDHIALATKRGLLDFPRAAKVSGSGFIVYRGPGAALERALINFLLDIHTREHGYTEVSPPFLVRGECMEGTGQLPKFGEDMYAMRDDDLYLIPTAEVPVTNLHRDELLAAQELPLRYVAYTPCFRRESGSAGRDTRGMIRVHQFDKVELVHIVRPEESYATLETLRGHAETVLQRLGLHYRVLGLCTGDLGFGAAKCYDLELWAPGLGTWLEVSSCSNFEEFQARRMNLRFKDEEGKNRPVHTLNGSGTALARLFIALVETYQQADGTISIPPVLRPYLHHQDRL